MVAPRTKQGFERSSESRVAPRTKSCGLKVLRGAGSRCGRSNTTTIITTIRAEKNVSKLRKLDRK